MPPHDAAEPTTVLLDAPGRPATASADGLPGAVTAETPLDAPGTSPATTLAAQPGTDDRQAHDGARPDVAPAVVPPAEQDHHLAERPHLPPAARAGPGDDAALPYAVQLPNAWSGSGPAANDVATAASFGDDAATLPPLHAQIARAVMVQVRQGRSSVRVQLEPAALGRVDVHIAVAAGRVTVRLAAESVAAGQALESALPHLRAALEQQGLQADRCTVEFGNASPQPGWTQGDGYRQPLPQQQPVWMPSRQPAPEEEAPAPAVRTPPVRAASGIDYRA